MGKGRRLRGHLPGLLVVGLALILFGVSCAPPTPARPPTGQPTPVGAPPPPPRPTEFRIAVGIDPDTLDPVQMTTTTVANMVRYMVETLLALDEEGKTNPLLATEWSASPDGMEYTFKLRRGVNFHDGTPFNAQAVKFTIDRVLDPDVRVPIRASYVDIKEAQVVDDFTVKLVMKRPFAGQPGTFVWMTPGVISPASVEKMGNTYKNIVHPVGTGPYVFKERVKGERLVVEKFPGYWGPKPYYDRVVFQIVPEAATRESLLLAGQADLIILPPVADLPALERNPDVKVLLAPSDRSIFVAINNTVEPLTDKRVRQALNYAVNKKEIIDKVLFGTGVELDAPMAPFLFGYCKVGSYEYNPDKARALLREAGVTTPLNLKFIAPTGRYIQDFQAGQAIAGFLSDIGVNAPVSTMDWPSYVATIVKTPPEVDLHYLGWAPAFMDAAQQMLQFWSGYHPPKGLATSFYKNPEVDRLILEARRELDPKRRAELYCQASRIIWDDAPWIFLWYQKFPIVYSAKVTNISYRPSEEFYAIYARPTR